jgi:hypothetical protein
MQCHRNGAGAEYADREPNGATSTRQGVSRPCLARRLPRNRCRCRTVGPFVTFGQVVVVASLAKWKNCVSSSFTSYGKETFGETSFAIATRAHSDQPFAPPRCNPDPWPRRALVAPSFSLSAASPPCARQTRKCCSSPAGPVTRLVRTNTTPACCSCRNAWRAFQVCERKFHSAFGRPTLRSRTRTRS